MLICEPQVFISEVSCVTLIINLRMSMKNILFVLKSRTISNEELLERIKQRCDNPYTSYGIDATTGYVVLYPSSGRGTTTTGINYSTYLGGFKGTYDEIRFEN